MYDVFDNLMKEKGVTMYRVCKDTKIAQATLIDWREGKSHPKDKKMRTLADYFGVSVDYLLTGKKKEMPAATATDTDCPVVPIYNALNESGRNEYVRYGRYLTAQPEYLTKDAKPHVEYIRHYLTAAAAGYAAPVEGEDYEEIPLPAGAPHGADYCINIDGDSMEPYIKNGSMVYVKQGADVEEMSDVGIFFVDGDVLCKQWCVDFAGTLHLLSANPKRENANRQIRKDATSTVVCFGKVLLNKKLPAPVY